MWPFEASYPAFKPADVGTPLSQVKHSTSSIPTTYDYIVVGGGTAGCCLASRLSEQPGVSVLLIERGGVVNTWVNRVPLLSSDQTKKDSIARPARSQPLVHANDRTITMLRGEALGGASRVNAMLYTRGIPGEYNLWRDLGHPNWDYNNLKPYFIKSETSLSQPRSDYRGKTGTWVNQVFSKYPYRILKCFENAANSLGIQSVPDFNSPSVPSVSCAALDIATDANMRRSSTFTAFLSPSVASERKEYLKICPNSLVTRLVLDSKPGRPPRVIGVEFVDCRGDSSCEEEIFYAKAKLEVVVCCGAIGTPQLLMLSGIGPAAHLKEHDIEVIFDSPGVGNYLKDHVDLPVMFNVPIDESIFVLMKKPWRALIELAKYVVGLRSLFSEPFVHTAIFLPSRLLNDNMEFVASDPTDLDSSLPRNVPDIEIKPIPIYGTDPEPGFTITEGVFTLMVCLFHPVSSGCVRLNSADPFERPMCQLGFYSDPHDIQIHTKGVRLALRLAEQIRAQGYPLKDLSCPLSESEEDIHAYIRKMARSGFHYSSTCRMAPFAENGVVDDELKVHGIEGLRICDTSVFPDTIGAHTMAPAVVVAEKCADMMKSRK